MGFILSQSLLESVRLLGDRLSGDFAAAAKETRRLAAFTLDLARIFAPLAVRVNAVAPGPVLAPSGVHEKAAPVPLGRPSPDDVAHAVSFLLAAPATTGCIIPVTGAFDMI